MPRRSPVVIVCALAAGCSAPSPWKRTAPPLFHSPQLVVFREHHEAEGVRKPLGYKHPVRVEPEKMAAVLSRITFDKRTLFKASQQAAFLPEQIRTVSEPLALALGEITPDERLRFVAIQQGLLGKVYRPFGTTGVMFSTEPGTLEIAFAEIDEALSLPDDNAPMKIRFDEEPTELTDASRVIPAAGMDLHRSSERGLHPRWVSVRLDDVPALPAAPVVAAPPAPPPATPGPAAQASAPPAAPPPQPAAADPQREARYQELRQRLETLRRLRQDGALTEEQYTVEYEKAMAELGK